MLEDKLEINSQGNSILTAPPTSARSSTDMGSIPDPTDPEQLLTEDDGAGDKAQEP